MISLPGPATILMTGGTGFLGSSLFCSLVSSGNRVVLIKRSNSDTSRISGYLDRAVTYDIDVVNPEKIFREHDIDTILHCATNYGRGGEDPRTVLEANLFLPLTLLEMGSKNGVRCFINTDTILDKRVSTYSLSKAQFKEWLKLYSSAMSCINVALEHFYGAGDDRTKFVTYIIRSMLEKVERIPLTAGEQKRDFIYIDDVVSAFLLIIAKNIEKSAGFSNYEIGTGTTVTIRDFVGIVRKLVGDVGTCLDFGALPYREREVMESAVDISAIQELGWSPCFPIEDGLRQTIEMERRLG